MIFALVDWVHRKMFAIVPLKQPSVQVFQQDAILRYIAQKRMIIVRKANNALKIH